MHRSRVTRCLVGCGSAVHDPDVADFNEHEILTGATLLLRNRP